MTRLNSSSGSTKRITAADCLAGSPVIYAGAVGEKCKPESKEVRDDVNSVSFVPAVEFSGKKQGDGLYISVGLLHADYRYKLGEPVSLLLTLHNTASEPRQSFRSSIQVEYVVRVTDEAGRLTPFNAFGERMWNDHEITAMILHSLQPEQAFRETYPVSKFYDLSKPGVYVIRISRFLSRNRSKKTEDTRWVKHEVGPIMIIVGDVKPSTAKRVIRANKRLKPQEPKAVG